MTNHPIDPAVRTEIMARLAGIESEHEVRVLYACESGSRGWGFASRDSDYDVRFLYVHRLPWYLTVLPGRDVIEQPVSEVFDVSGWDLRKTLGLLRGGNATLVEWLQSPVVYRADEVFVSAIRSAAKELFLPERCFHHYFNSARNNYEANLRGETVNMKRLLYTLRPMLAASWIERHGDVPPMVFQRLVEGLIEDDALKQAIAEMVAFKQQAGEGDTIAPDPRIRDYIERELVRLSKYQPHKTEGLDFGGLDRLLHDTVMGEK